MSQRTILTGFPLLVAISLLAQACSEPVAPDHRHMGAHPLFATTGAPTGITLDQSGGVLNDAIPWGQGQTHIGKGFVPTNPHPGDAIVATFFWVGSTNTIVTVTDHLCDPNNTPVGNTYNLVEYVTAGGISMATYVATNVQGFPDPETSSTTALCVHAIFSNQITEGGVMLSAYSGVSTVSASALGAHQSATGSGSGTTIADPGSIPVGAGGLAYGVSMSAKPNGLTGPAGFTNIITMSDSAMTTDGEYTVVPAAGTTDPRWAWAFNSPSTWLATVLTLTPSQQPPGTPTHLVYLVQPSNTMLPGMTITPPVQVAAADDLGNTATAFAGPVTIAIAHDGSLLQNARLSGTTTVTAVNGVATFGNLSIDQLGMGYTLRATASGLIGITSNPFNVAP
jgi:hypothetical protein